MNGNIYPALDFIISCSNFTAWCFKSLSELLQHTAVLCILQWFQLLLAMCDINSHAVGLCYCKLKYVLNSTQLQPTKAMGQHANTRLLSCLNPSYAPYSVPKWPMDLLLARLSPHVIPALNPSHNSAYGINVFPDMDMGR